MTRASRRGRRQRGDTRKHPPEASAPSVVVRKRRLVVAALAMALVVGAVGFSLFRYFRSEAPARALEKWAAATREGDCDASYEALSKSVKEVSLVGEKENWCQLIGSPNFIGPVSTSRTLRWGSTACVVAEVENPDGTSARKVFVLVEEDGAWRVDLGTDPRSSGVPGCPEA